MALVDQPVEFRFPWFQQGGTAPTDSDQTPVGRPSGAGQAEHQAAVEREFQAAMQFYSRGGGGGVGGGTAFPLAPSDYVSPDERLRLCQEPIVPYKPSASTAQTKPQQHQQSSSTKSTTSVSTTKYRRPSKDGAVQTDLSLPLPAWSPRPTPLTALLGAAAMEAPASSLQHEQQQQQQQQQGPPLRRSSSFVDLTSSTKPAVADPGRPPPIRRPRTPPASILRQRPASAAAGARPAQRGPVWGGDERSITAMADPPAQQLYDLTQLRRSNLRLNDELGPDPTKVYMGDRLVDRPYPAEHPFSSHQPRKSLFPRFAPPQPGSEPAHPDRLEMVERAGSGQWRHEIFHLGGPPRQLVWPGDNFNQVPKLSRQYRQPVYYPVPPQTLGANAAMAPDPSADPSAVDTLRNLERDHWRSQYSRSFTGCGQEFPVGLTDWQQKQTDVLRGDIASSRSGLQQLALRSFEPPRPQEGRIARRLAAGEFEPALPSNSRQAAEHRRPETERERSERWLLEGREYRNLPDSWDALVHQQQWRAASRASSRPESPNGEDGKQRLDKNDDVTGSRRDGGQAWDRELENRYQAYSRHRIDSAQSGGYQQQQQQLVADTDTLSDIAWLRRKYQPASVVAGSNSYQNFNGSSLTDTLGLPPPSSGGYLPGPARLCDQQRQPIKSQQPDGRLACKPATSKGVNFDSDVMVAYGYGSEPVYLAQEQLRDGAAGAAPSSSCQQSLPTTPYRTELHDLQRAYSKSDVRREFHSRFPGQADDLRDAIREGKRHEIYGINSQVLHG